ncbi:MAG: flavodoxin [Novosphingobium sp. 28-62-57]|uniref:flavodoxin family protein n=1 Tax=unclassified Novosphingobium TaxID=2644732 RepID=UPI000BD2B346|nr:MULTISPECIES: NAD(P)H-dependent oxidoreductase [unclassified Novosphingobium]OYW48935.1 MAG: flavodoxin [Novosphingobium sp. 12-62-10]OYZ44609.1 MAG: flavodoxin [Novosphingobium sp. 16-62-11]OZA39666.1 MAG: flavodoxin [Novosphingobium sp. 17-62-9]OYZ12665.1 MAG: flavodoxin [Novosphingobium sp. 28-62-57]HQS68608.1 NAD(P)H-dependent oxidoreductase [Novosphingobium sp.]
MASGLLIIWHSRTGAAQAMAQAAFEAACTSGPCRMIGADEAVSDDLLAAQGYLFCCPENLGSMTGMMKEFFDRTYYPLLARIEGRPYATMIAAGSDGSGAGRQIDRIVTGWRLRRIAEPLVICTKAQAPHDILADKHLLPEDVQKCRDLGQAVSAGLDLGVF